MYIIFSNPYDLWGGPYYYLHLTDEKTKEKKGLVMGTRLHTSKPHSFI